MSYTRTAIVTATIVISIAAAATGTQPASATAGLAGTLPPQDRVISHEPALQAPQASSEPAPAPVYTTTITAETAEQQATAELALAEMEAAGFDLPPVTIYMHSDRADCSGDPNRVLNGYFVQIEGENIVHSCGNLWTLLHELAHVWDLNVMDDDTRHQLMEHQGVESWHSGTWNEAGGEHFASIVAWAIEGTHPTRIGYFDRDHLTEAYAMATGDQPPAMTNATSVTATPAAPTVTVETAVGAAVEPPQ